MGREAGSSDGPSRRGVRKRGFDNPAREVHHLTYEYGLGNTPNHLLQALCGPCHDAEHPEKAKRYLTPDEATKAIEELSS